jgi:hypothetical protein
MPENARKPFIFCDFPETAKNYLIKMNGFSGFSAKVDKNEWVLSKSKIGEENIKYKIDNDKLRK